MRFALLGLAFALFDISPPAQGLHPKLLDFVRKHSLANPGERTKPKGLAVSPSGSHAAVVNASGKVFVVDLETGKLFAEVAGLNATSVAFGRDNLLAVGTQKGTVVLCSEERFKTQSVVTPAGDARAVTRMLFGAGGRCLAVQNGMRVALIDAVEGKTLGQYAVAGEPKAGWAFDASGRRLFLIGENGKITVVDVSDGSVSQQIPKPAALTDAKLGIPTIDPTGRLIAYRADKVRAYNIAAGGDVRELEAPARELQDLEFMENGTYLVAFSVDEVRFWNTTSWKLERVLTVGSDKTSTNEIAAAPGTNRLVTVDEDSGVRVWGLRARKDVQEKRKGWLGVGMSSIPGGGVYVSSVHEESPAAKAGLQIGDVIQEIDGAKVNSTDELLAEIKKRFEGDAVELTLQRGEKQTLKLKAVLGGTID